MENESAHRKSKTHNDIRKKQYVNKYLKIREYSYWCIFFLTSRGFSRPLLFVAIDRVYCQFSIIIFPIVFVIQDLPVYLVTYFKTMFFVYNSFQVQVDLCTLYFLWTIPYQWKSLIRTTTK